MTKPLPLTKEERGEARAMFAAARPITEIADYLGCQASQVHAVIRQIHPRPRTSGGLRDLLFDEIASLQRGDTEPQRAMAVSNLAKQIINIAKAEVEFSHMAPNQKEAPCLGSLQLGSLNPVADADESATEV